jgi:hypothetical protein
MYTGKKSTIEIKAKPEQKFDAAYGTILRISKCKQKLHINFSLELYRLKIKKSLGARKYWFNCIGLPKNSTGGK